MWKRTFIRLTFILMLGSATVLVVAAANARKEEAKQQCPESGECCKNNGQNDNIMIWESVSRTILGSVQY